jgi:hypothetical protein
MRTPFVKSGDSKFCGIAKEVSDAVLARLGLEAVNGIRRLNLKRPLRAYHSQVPEGTCQFEAGISNP